MVIEAEFPGVICCGPAVFLIVIPLCSRVAPIPTPDRLLSSVFLKTTSTASILRDEMCGMRVKRYSTESPPPVIRSNSLCIFFGTTVGLTTYRYVKGGDKRGQGGRGNEGEDVKGGGKSRPE